MPPPLLATETPYSANLDFSSQSVPALGVWINLIESTLATKSVIYLYTPCVINAVIPLHFVTIFSKSLSPSIKANSISFSLEAKLIKSRPLSESS